MRISKTTAAVAAILIGAGAPALAQDAMTAEVMTADGTAAGTVTFEQVEHGVVIIAELENLPEGPHGFHIHETGACEPDFQAAGGHYSPTDNVHGFNSPDGYHAGDLPNIHVAADGTAQAEFFAPHLMLGEPEGDGAPFTLADEDGSAIMVHENGDDYQADPSGSTGSRIACGVIAPAQGD
ncbi:superoxide dismutase family protein [Tranquillimonas alkanivorans]|uniref:Superoxide dismutase, Cu-Zn family n=1 Tax=Tranquillimonas alkanivorans TaxID=441119 RepID=A0A1I5QC01_9RHOB|nr:superoxide dismutase family protein [Tranquillimonas alkanivorans]SFP43627.1 superoxide dismutase, Cu-Zn family [Tranquillimonas alkanivorans]